MKQPLTVIALLAISAAAPAAAQSQAQPQAQAQTQAQQPQAAKKSSADDVICEKEIDLGSRISTHKICHTRSQWADLLQQSRDDVDRAQAQRAMSGN